MSWSLLGVHERVNSQMIQRNRTLIWAELRFFFPLLLMSSIYSFLGPFALHVRMF